jgi:hypothetical protein
MTKKTDRSENYNEAENMLSVFSPSELIRCYIIAKGEPLSSNDLDKLFTSYECKKTIIELERLSEIVYKKALKAKENAGEL